MDRVYHHWEKWECYKAGFYGTSPPHPMTPDEAREEYAIFLSDLDRFEHAVNEVFLKWPHSCDQFLTNENINRLAWIGQAAMCIETGVPSHFRGGFRMLSLHKQRLANAMAEKKLDEWLKRKGNEESRTVHTGLGEMRLF